MLVQARAQIPVYAPLTDPLKGNSEKRIVFLLPSRTGLRLETHRTRPFPAMRKSRHYPIRVYQDQSDWCQWVQEHMSE